jgi:hypothetical protein
MCLPLIIRIAIFDKQRKLRGPLLIKNAVSYRQHENVVGVSAATPMAQRIRRRPTAE